MKFDLVGKCNELSVLEKNIISISKKKYKGNYNHWTLINTINHTCCWKLSALHKIELRINGREAYYHDEKSIETIKKNIF
jgi:hypothetical protein